MFEEVGNIGAVVALIVEASRFAGYAHVLFLAEFASQVRAVDNFLAHLRADGGASQGPVGEGVEAGGEYVAAMEVLTRLRVAYQLKMIQTSHPR